ncbi:MULTISPECIES: hypothetical protein [Enterococcus]|uniref:Uncharacterized protein n=3 Tax=Enterococcus TaxID=1350 RepID=A0A2H4HI62_ENTFL|nr:MULTISPECIES: hypothetical protein [Enterococcus]ARQ19151.1 Hypothetical protein [Enterococcus faecalis]ELB16306.1 hypothetical protein OIQ_05531 [Enterococcus faecium EnGen0025]EOI35675.1 hypothetical protein UIS_02899 [Enterococcus faecium EnGen0313]MCA6745625.1 hypothetical protein [Enterococcus lactis]MCU1810078.1 hypothetical protein [Enterococcus faecium]
MKVQAMTKRKGLMDVSELNAYQVAYGKPLDYRDYFNYVGLPCLFMGGFSFALCYYWWIALICGVIGGVYGFKVIMPKSIKRSYELKSLQERNKFINNMTQILTDDSKTVTRALSIAKQRTKGELREDIQILESRLQGADKFQIAEAFREINNKYYSDVVFTQYFEQLETAIYEGRNNSDTMKQIKSYHNDVKRKTEGFMKIKDGYLQDMKQMMFIVAVFIGAITFAFGFSTFYEGFARSPIGWVFGSIYFLIMVSFMKSFFKHYFDDEIMSLGVSN